MKTVRRWILLAILVTGCDKQTGTPKVSQVSKPPPPSAFTNSLLVDIGLETAESARDPRFVLIGTNPTKSSALLWDGKAGVNIGPDGTGHSPSGSSLPSFVNQYYDEKENVKPFSSPLDVVILANGIPVSPMSEGYGQSLDMRYGLLTTHWFAKVAGGELEARLSNTIDYGHLLSRWEFSAPPGTRLEVRAKSGWPVSFGDLYPGNVPDDEAPKKTMHELSDRHATEFKLTRGRATWFKARPDRGLHLHVGRYCGPMFTSTQAKRRFLGACFKFSASGDSGNRD